jgi:hypothetical protein
MNAFLIDHLSYNIDYRCEDRRKVGELRNEIGAVDRF